MKPPRAPHPLRRLALALLLPLLMLLAQQGAQVHALGHLQASPSSSSTDDGDDDKLARQGLCLTCLAYAGIDNASAPLSFAAPLLSFSHAWVAADLSLPLPAERPAARSRGPPRFL